MSAMPAASLLAAATPARWFDVACERWRELLVDHANCEKKAASTALSLMFAYAEDVPMRLDWRARLAELARIEAALATSPDPQFRFHSGTPVPELT